jgi:hypothetical protein
MAHYAKVLDGKVTKVLVAEAEFFDTFIDSSSGDWIQTSYNTSGNQHRLGGTPLRGNFAGVGYTYDREHDVFYAPSPFPSWELNHDNWLWEAPTPMPTDGKMYGWNEFTKSWDVIEIE